MEIQNITTHLIILFKFDEIRFAKLLNRSNTTALGQLLDFSEIQQVENKVILQHGIHKNHGQGCAINRLVIEERKLVIDLEGTSDDAEYAFLTVRQFLADLAGKTDSTFLQPIIKSQESEIISKMNIDITSIYSQKFLESVLDVEPNLMDVNATAKIAPASVTFSVQFLPKNTLLDDYRIGISRKDLVFGLRPGFPLSEKMFYSRMPTDSNSHIEFLIRLEKALGE